MMQSGTIANEARASAAPCLEVSTEFCGSSLGARYLAGRGADFLIADGGKQVALVARREQGFVLRFRKHWKGWACIGGHTHSLPELAASALATVRREAGDEVYEFAIPSDGTIVVQFDLLEFWIRPTPSVEKVPGRRLLHKGDPIFRYCLGVALLVLGLVAAVGTLPEESKRLSSVRFDPSPFLLESRPDSSVESLRAPQPSTDRPRSASKEPPLTPEISEEPDATEEEKVAGVRAKARSAGIVGLEIGEAIAGVAGSVDMAYSEEEAERLKGLLPSEVDAKTGAWGHGIVKIGPGSGDGKDWGTVKTRGYGAVGGGKIGNAYVAKALTRPHETKAPAPTKAMASILESGIPYDVIRGRLGLRERRFSRCFESTSAEEEWPSLVHLRFAIAPTGEVKEAEAEDLDGHSAEACVVEVLRSIQFPEPSDGKVVRVEHFPVRV